MKRSAGAGEQPVRTGRKRADRSGRDQQDEGADSIAAQPRRSVLGRPRTLTAAQIEAVLAWHDARVSLKEFAASLGVSTSTVTHVIKSRGSHYKQAPPEERAASLSAHRERRRALEEAHWL